MRYMEYGNEHAETIVLLHGGGLSWWNYREAAENLSLDYRVILPILDGHAQSGCDFTSIEDAAANVIGLIDEQFGGSVLLIGGLSLGGQIALEILSRKRDICRFALIESAMVIPSRLTRAMIRSAFGSCYGLIKQRWFAQLQFRSLRIKAELFEEYFRDTCGISKANMIAFLEANASYRIKPSFADCAAKTCLLVGEREPKSVRKSAEVIRDALPGSILRVLPSRHHGEFSINNAGNYARTVREIIQNG